MVSEKLYFGDEYVVFLHPDFGIGIDMGIFDQSDEKPKDMPEAIKGSGLPYHAVGPLGEADVIWDDLANTWCLCVNDDVRSTHNHRSEAVELARKVVGI